MDTKAVMNMTREFSVAGVTHIDIGVDSSISLRKLISLRESILESSAAPDARMTRRFFMRMRKALNGFIYQVMTIRVLLTDGQCASAYSFYEYRRAEISGVSYQNLEQGKVRVFFKK